MEEAETLCDRVAIVDHGRLIAMGTPRELVASLGAEHVIQISVDHGAEVPLERLKQLPGVKDARFTDGMMSLRVSELHSVMPALLAELERGHLSMSQLATHHATLEDVFVAHTGRHLRDE
jgi:ABC-2 type transport system ATP-binding protein